MFGEKALKIVSFTLIASLLIFVVGFFLGLGMSLQDLFGPPTTVGQIGEFVVYFSLGVLEAAGAPT